MRFIPDFTQDLQTRSWFHL